MNDNHNPDVQSADGADVDQITVMFDTSVLLYVIMDEVGLSHDIKFTPHVRKFVKGKNQAVSKEVASQIEIRLKEKKSKGRARNESIGGSGVGSMIERAVKTLREKYEIIDTDEWKSYSEKIENILSTLVSNPEHAMSQNWLTRKKTLLFKKRFCEVIESWRWFWKDMIFYIITDTMIRNEFRNAKRNCRGFHQDGFELRTTVRCGRG